MATVSSNSSARTSVRFLWLVGLLLSQNLSTTNGFSRIQLPPTRTTTGNERFTATLVGALGMLGDDNGDSDGADLSLDSLIDMDVVIYSDSDDETETKLFGALQEDGTLAPLSAWTTEPAFGESIEFLVDEEDRFSLDTSKVKLHYMVDQSELSYGSRQCHRGVGNPHGEESELLYYVNQSVIDKFEVKLALKPDLEILW